MHGERSGQGRMLGRYLSAVAAWVAGIVLLQCQPALPPWPPFLLAAGGTALLAWRWPRTRGVAIVLLLFLLGFAYADWRAGLRLADRLAPELEGRPLQVEGHVSDLPQATRFGQRFLFVPSRAEVPLPAAIQVNWYGQPDRVRAGERWRLTLLAKRPHGQANPGSFDLESWFLQQGIGATASVRQGERLDGLAASAWLARLRARLRERVHAALPGAPYAPVIVALTVGDQGGIPPEQWQRYAATGVTHLISISGLHVTLLAGLIAALVQAGWRRLPRLAARLGAPRAGLLAGVLTALGYCALAGLAVPTQRTLLMLLVAAFCLWRARPAPVSAIWACALALVLLFDPFAVLAVGFWLSFLTVGALLWLGGNRLGPGPRWQGWVGTQWAATLGSAPILLLVFGQLPLVSPLANAGAIPLVSLGVTPLALAGLLEPTGGLLYLAERLYALTDAGLQWCAAVPGGVLTVTPPPLWTLLPAALGVALWLAPRGVPGRPLGAVLLLPLALLRPDPLPEGHYRATVLDVGQGLSVLVETRHTALLFDTGALPNGVRVGLPALRAGGQTRLETLILSHNDSDHVGSAEALLAQSPPAQIWHSLPEALPWLATVAARRRCERGARWERDGVRFELLWPPPDFMRKNKNSLSCVLLVDNGRHRLLLPADLGSAQEKQLLAAGLPPLSIVVAAHHGGKGSSSAAFVTATAPQYVVFSAGYRNRFQHPRPEIVSRYAAAGARILRTDESGALRFEVGDGIQVQAWRTLRRRYWSAAPA